MMRRSDCWLQITILSLTLLLLQVPSYSKAFTITANGPEDPNSANRMDFPNVKKILSVSSPFPHLINADPKKGNEITYSGKIPSKCPIPMTITALDKDGKIVKYTGTVTYGKFNSAALPSAVGITGDEAKLKELISELEKTYDVQVVSKKPSPPPQGNSEIGIILADKANPLTFVRKRDAEDAVDSILKMPTFGGLKPLKGDCGISCFDICDAVLALNGSKSVTKASVKSPTDKVDVYLPTMWTSACNKVVIGICDATTCFNGGSCATNRDTSFDLCTCNPKTNLYGPRCQLLTRSYDGTASSDVTTNHDVKNDGSVQQQTLTFSFEHIGKCQLTTGLCTIANLKTNNGDLVTVTMGTAPNRFYTTASLPADIPASDAGKMVLFSDKMVQNNQWLDVTVFVTLQSGIIQATTVFCTKNASPHCTQRSISKPGVMYRTPNSVVSFGGNFRGCFRNARFNGRLVDLKLRSPPSGTQEGCSHQSGSCSGKCGDGDANSVCYGSTTASSCSCKCGSLKRRPAETISRPRQCSAECSSDSPIISIGPSGTLNWRPASGATIPLDPLAPLTISFLMRTKESNANELLKLVEGSFTLTITLARNFLSACISGTCYSFSSVEVNGGNWHSIFVMLAQTQLTVRVDDYARVFLITASQSISGATISVLLPNGCIRGVRLSGIYMPTSGTDRTEDTNPSNSIRMDSAGPVTAGPTCTTVR